MNEEEIKHSISQLVNKFKPDTEYGEKDTETKLIEPLMECLGWDVRGDDIQKGKRLRKDFTDYIFRINGRTHFIIEAKAKGVGLTLDKRYAGKTFVEQTLDYARSCDCTWAILTNFEELRLYSTDRKDNNGLVFSIQYNEYTNQGFESLCKLSKEYGSSGKLDAWGERYGFKNIRIPIDKVLYRDLLDFRELLSKDLLQNNSWLKEDITTCDEIVQKLLDRFIFIRNCEDRHIENDKLMTLVGSKNIIKQLRTAFTDEKKYGYYNSTIFQKHELDNHSILISDDTLNKVIEGLYQSPNGNNKYDFSEIKSDVLGVVYEQYLSHLLQKRKKGGLGENLGKKKEQGIYYTPPYIVEYIIKKTLGTYLAKRTGEDVKILDMACGSGSFLIKSYDALIERLVQEKSRSKAISQTTIELEYEYIKGNNKVKIIEENIYGVDLDKQAVEIAQLNLLLKLKQRVKLPFTNIICGNSLLDEENFEANFGLFEEFNVKKNQFDVIVGNPPYVDIKELDNEFVRQLFAAYKTVENRMNLYSVFIERALQILKDGGYFGFIIPNSILYNKSYSKIRKLLLENVCILEIVRLPDNVFEGVKVETIILIFQKKKKDIENNICKVLIYNPTDKINSISGNTKCASAM